MYLLTGYHTGPGKRWPVIRFLHGGGERGDALEDLDQILAHGSVAEAWIQERDRPFIMISPRMPLFDRPHRSSDQPTPKRIEDGPPPPGRYGRRPTQPMARVTDPSVLSYTASMSTASWTKMEDELLAMGRFYSSRVPGRRGQSLPDRLELRRCRNVARGDDRPNSLGRDRANLWSRRSQSGRSDRER